MICITIERLTCFNFFFYVLPHLVSLKRCRPRQTIRVCFIDTTRLGQMFARAVLAVFSIALEPLVFRSLDIRDPQGDWLRLTIFYGEFMPIQDKICADPFLDKVRTESREHFFLYLKKSTVSFAWGGAATVWRLLILMRVSFWWASRQQEKVEENFLFADRRIWTKYVQAYAHRQGVRFKPVRRFNVDVKPILKTCIGEPRLKCLQAFVHKSKIIFPSVLRNTGGEGKLVLEYYGSFHLNGPQHYSDFAFWQQSSFPGKDILVSSHLTNVPFNEEQFGLMRANGMEAVALHPKATRTDHIPVFCQWRQGNSFPAVSVHRQAGYGQEYQWVKQAEGEFLKQTGYYQSFFKTFNAKIYLSWFKYGAHHIAVAQAIRSAGGIMAMYQRAMEQAPSPETAVYCDVFFGFSAMGGAIERQSGSRVPYYVVTGYLGDHRFALLKGPAFKLRQQLMAAGARKIMAFLDENSAADVRWSVGHEFIRQNYAFVLEKVLSEKDFGLVIKPKTPATLRQRLGPCLPLLEKALATGRCFVYDESHIYSTYPPAIAALSADITVHGHLCAATAGLESALAGVPTLLLDREGWRACSLYGLGEGKVVFRSWEDLWQACQEHWCRPGGVDGFGDWSAFLREFDPFRDGRASQRMGEYLKWLMQGFKDQLPRDQILAQAAERYARQWGKDKILNIGSFHDS